MVVQIKKPYIKNCFCSSMDPRFRACGEMLFSGAGLRARLRHEVAEMLSFRLRRNAGAEAGATDFFTGSFTGMMR